MTDIVDPATRSRMMSSIRGKDTKPEMIVRRLLHHRGFRYRLHAINLPGKPDIVLGKYHAVVMINGCFWHRHGCNLFHWPKSNKHLWRKKLNRNATVDKKNIASLLEGGWRVQVIWECALRGEHRLSEAMLVYRMVRWLMSQSKFSEIRADGP